MKSYSLRVIALASIPVFGACAEDVSGPTGPGVKIAVAPLQLTGIGDACYDIQIDNATGNVVTLTNICASQYGNNAGGDITYVAPCDASSDSNTGDGFEGVQNKVTVWPTLYSAAFNPAAPSANILDTDTWVDPCGDDGCSVHADCNENSDTLVEFNFTVLRSAQQGFFDVAVNFSDIFCSAKVDCRYTDADGNQADWIRNVHGSDGSRTATAVVAFACTDGNFGNDTTKLYASDVTVTCGSDTYTVPVNKAGTVRDFDLTTEGNQGPSGPIESALVFTGKEALQVGTQNAGKVYWNTAIGFHEAGTTGQPQILSGSAPALGCTLTFSATASQGALDLDGNGFLSHPFLQASVQLTTNDGDGLLVCEQNPVNSASFETVYRDSFPSSIVWTLDGDQAEEGEAARR